MRTHAAIVVDQVSADEAVLSVAIAIHGVSTISVGIRLIGGVVNRGLVVVGLFVGIGFFVAVGFRFGGWLWLRRVGGGTTSGFSVSLACC